MALEIGQTIHHDRYRIDRLLGQGGMGAVYLAWDTSLEIPVAIKENLDASPEAQKQFNREAQILARLAHPNLPRVIDNFFIPDAGQYLVMDFVEGEDLQSMLDSLGRLPEPQVLSWISQICEALAYLHNQTPAVIHRDIKPGNIKIRPDGRAMLVDFGIAKVYDPVLATTIGARAFTPGYSPPEQYGTGSTDRRSDIYALGATIYCLLTGRTPPDSIKRLLKRVEMSPPRQINDEISPTMEKIILHSTELDTENRYQSVEELLAEIRQPDIKTGDLEKTESIQRITLPTYPEETHLAAQAKNAQLGSLPLTTTGSKELVPTSVKKIPLPAQRFPIWLWVILGIGILILAGLCVTIFFQRIMKRTNISIREVPIRTTLAALPNWNDSTPNVEPVISTPKPTPGVGVSATPGDTPMPSQSPGETPTSLSSLQPSLAGKYQPIAQVIPPEIGGGVRGVAVFAGYLYLLTSDGMLSVFDVADISSEPGLQTIQYPISSLQLQNGNGLLQYDDFLYVYGNAGLDVVDISDPTAPDLLKNLTDQSIYNLSIYEDYLLAPGFRYLGVYDLSIPEFPRLVSQYDSGQEYLLFAATGYQKLVYVSGFHSSNPDYARNLILDFNDPTSLHELNAYDHNRMAYHYLIVHDQLIACADSALEIWELSEPDKPRLLFSEPAQARVCALDGEMMVTNGTVARLEPGNIGTISTFDAGDGQMDGFPYGSAVTQDFVFLTQAGRVLILAKVTR